MTREQSDDGLVSGGIYQALGYRFEVLLDAELPRNLETDLHWAFEGLVLSEPDGTEADHCYRLEFAEFADPDDEDPVLRIHKDGAVVRPRVPVSQALVVLMTDVNQHAIESRADRLTVHAGAVSRDGLGILLPGSSGSGKSTTTAALVASGCGYLSDEAVSIDFVSLLMEPYAKPLSLSERSLRALGQRQYESGQMTLVPPTLFRSGSVGVPVPPSLLVFPYFDAGLDTSLLPISRGEALVELANNSFNFVHHGGDWLPGLRDVVAACSCWRLTTSNPTEAAVLILGHLGS